MILVLAGFTFETALAPADDWPQWLGPNRDGISREKGLLKSWPPGGPKVLWEKKIGEGLSSFVEAEGRAITLFQAGGSQWAVAFDAATGKELWRVRTGKELPDQKPGNPGPRATPTVEGDRVYALDGHGNLLCLKAADGKVLWARNICEQCGAKRLTWGVAASPLIDGNNLILVVGESEDAAIAALDKMTGELVWKALGQKPGYASPILADLGGVKQFVFFLGTDIVGITRDGKRVLWQYPWKTSYDVNAATPLVKGDQVFVGSGYNKGCALLEIDLKADPPVKAIWENRELRCQLDTAILHEGYLYGFDDINLCCIEFASGKRMWEEKRFGQGALTMADGLLYVLGNGNLGLVRPTPKGFDMISNVDGILAKRCWTKPTVANGRLYLRDEEQFKCLNVKTQ
jgi:outer membrane protein assembly factor BamB